MKNVFQRLGWFVAVGTAAALTHWMSAVASVAFLHVPPYLANFFGWLIAVVVSFLGHYCFTFGDREAALSTAVPRFLLLSAGGFALNELSFVFLLNRTGIAYYWLLAMILLAIAALTFLVSRYWVFLRKA